MGTDPKSEQAAQTAVLENIDLAIKNLEMARADAARTIPRQAGPAPLNAYGEVERAIKYTSEASKNVCNIPTPPQDTFAPVEICLSSLPNKIAVSRIKVLLETAKRNMEIAIRGISKTDRTKSQILIFLDYTNRALTNLREARIEASKLTTRIPADDQREAMKIIRETLALVTKIRNDTTRDNLNQQRLNDVTYKLTQINELICSKKFVNLREKTVECTGNWSNQAAFNVAKTYMSFAWKYVIEAKNTDNYNVFMEKLLHAQRALNGALNNVSLLRLKANFATV